MQLEKTPQKFPSFTSLICQPDLPLQVLDWLKILRQTTMTHYNKMLDHYLIVALK